MCTTWLKLTSKPAFWAGKWEGEAPAEPLCLADVERPSGSAGASPSHQPHSQIFVVLFRTPQPQLAFDRMTERLADDFNGDAIIDAMEEALDDHVHRFGFINPA